MSLTHLPLTSCCCEFEFRLEKSIVESIAMHVYLFFLKSWCLNIVNLICGRWLGVCISLFTICYMQTDIVAPVDCCTEVKLPWLPLLNLLDLSPPTTQGGPSIMWFTFFHWTFIRCYCCCYVNYFWAAGCQIQWNLEFNIFIVVFLERYGKCSCNIVECQIRARQTFFCGFKK